MNIAISRKTDGTVKAAEKYEIVSLADNIVTINVNGTMVQCGLDDPDFLFLFSVQEHDIGEWKIDMKARDFSVVFFVPRNPVD